MSELAANMMKPDDRKTTDDNVYLVDLLIILVRQKKLLVLTPIVTGTLALIASLLMTPMFTSTAKILPPQQQQSSGMTAVLGQLGGLAGATGGLAGLKTPNDVYLGFLESRVVADSLIARFGLKQRYKKDGMDATRKTLAANTTVSSGKKDGFITIATTDSDPKFAADLANAYFDELSKLTQTLAITEASQRRLFFEKQLKAARSDLADAEVALRKTQEKTGMIQPEGQVQAIISSVAQLKGTIAAKEVQLNSMRTFAAGQNPELLRTNEELRALKQQLAKMEQNQPALAGDFMVPTGKIPEVGVEYVRSMRNVKYYETIFELLAKQFELAKIDEAKDAPLIQLLDKAIPAEHKSKPRRAFITLGGTLAGFILALVLAFLRESYIAARIDPASGKRWQMLSAAWSGRG